MTIASKCPVCDEGNTRIVDFRESVPTLQNVTLSSAAEARAYPTGVLNMCLCSNCSFVWNDAFDQNAINYDINYNNDVSGSQYYLDHLKKMADKVLASVPDDQAIHYVEIGCGQADFLKLVVNRSQGRVLTATGFDPSFNSAKELPDLATVHRKFFDETCLELVPEEANVICSRHTIEHVQDIQSFTKGLCLPMTKQGRTLIIETPDAGWILRNIAFQDLFYEHCSLFTHDSIRHLLAQHGLQSEVSTVYREQYLWAEGSLGAKDDTHEFQSSMIESLGDRYIDARSKLVAEWGNYISERSQLGPIAIWGAASKGVTFSLLFSETSNVLIDFAIDLNQAKQGRFLPTTGLEVISPKDAASRGVKTVIIMNPNYEVEIIELAKHLSWAPEFSVLNDTTQAIKD